MNAVAAGLGFDPEVLRRKYLDERDARLRDDGNNQYIDLDGDFATYAQDPYVEPGFTRAPIDEEIDAAVLGGGLSGLMTGVHLTELGVDDFRIIEQAGDFGGTWYWNRYPGIRCDIESYTYIPLLEEVGTIPSEKYAEGEEILAHCQAIGRKYGLYDRALFQTVVKSIRWDEPAARWIIRTNRDDTIRARHVIVSSGPLNKPKFPGIPGIRDFKGHAFHTSRWDYGYTGGTSSGGMDKLGDKRVALIGTGATGIQVLPHLAEAAEHVYVFQRTPSAVDRRNNGPTDVEWFKSQPTGWQERRMDNFCRFMMGMAEENLVDDCWTDISKLLVGFNTSTSPVIQNASPEERSQLADFMKMEQLRARIQEIVKDPATAESLKPWYNLFCKRPLFSDEYYTLFNRPNVTLVDTKGHGVDRITENALIVDGKAYEVDCVVFATGFRAGIYTHRSGGYELVGRNGVSLEERWREGVKSVHGLHASGFPNFHIVGTLAQASQSANYPQVTAFQTKHAARLVAKCLRENIRTMEVTVEAEGRWLGEMKAKAADQSQFEIECTPGYYNNEGNTRDSPSLFGAMYGGGPIEYVELLDKWYETGIADDVTLEYET